MKIIERYALACGSRISRPDINIGFFPIPFEKYITFNAASTNMPAKNYPFWSEVFSLILPKLNQLGIAVVQLGDTSEPQFAGVHRYNGQCNMSQSCYIVKNAMLHLGIDSFLTHVADALDIKICCIYGVSDIGSCGPYFSKKENCVLVNPTFAEGEKHYYNPVSPNITNTIYPEQIVSGLGKLLSIDFPTINTLYIGSQYVGTVLEIVPDSGVIPSQLFPNAVPMIRLDLGGSEQIMAAQIQTRKSAIFTNRPINLDIITQLKQNLERIIYLIDENYDLEFVKKLSLFNLPFVLLTNLDEDKIGLIKLELSEYGIIFKRPKGKRPNIKITNSTVYKTNKFLFSNNKTFLSTEHFRQNKHSDGSNRDIVIDNDGFWEDSEFLFVYDK